MASSSRSSDSLRLCGVEGVKIPKSFDESEIIFCFLFV